MPVVYNFMGFLAPFVKDISGISKPHVFLICKLADESIEIKVKKWHSTNDSWIGASKDSDEWIKLLSGFPEEHPETILPHADPDVIDQATINKYNQWLSEPVKAE